MKKTALFLSLVLLFSCLLPLAAHAEEAPEAKPLLELIKENSEEAREELSDTSLYAADDGERIYMRAEWVDDEPLLKVYNGMNWNGEAKTLEERIAYAEGKAKYSAYISFGDKIRVIAKVHEGGKNSIAMNRLYEEAPEYLPLMAYSSGIPDYLKDIIGGSTRQTFCGIECNVLDVVCFDGMYDPTVVYYKTDNGVFVRVYDIDPNTPVVELSESDFDLRSRQYYDYCLHRVEGDAEGSFWVVSFDKFLKNELWNEPLPSKVNVALILWIAIPCVLVLAGGATAFFLVRKKKKQKSTEE